MIFSSISLLAVVRLSANVAAGSSPTVSAGWYAGWTSDRFPPSKIAFDSVTTPDVNILSLDASDEKTLPDFVRQCHSHNVKALVSIGGWTGSRYFSSNLASTANRSAFVKTVTGLVSKYGVDGLDFDWEYPNRQGVGCNNIDPNDTPNFLSFLQQLRTDPIGKNLILTVAASIQTFNGTDGRPSSSLSDFAKVVNYIAIMNYDIWNTMSKFVGPNAPLDDSCCALKEGSATSGVANWIKAGIPASQLVLGIPAYGHSYRVHTKDAFIGDSHRLVAYPPFDMQNPSLGNNGDAGGPNVCGVQEGPSGYFDFSGLISAGFLNQNGKPANGIFYRYDPCSQTPYVYNVDTQVMVSYDDTDSMTLKGKFIKNNGMLGWAMWEVSGDSNNMLADAIRSSIANP